MRRVAVIMGSEQTRGEAALATLPNSDQAAIALALTRFGGQVAAYCLQHDDVALRYALAAGAATATRLDDVTRLDFDVVLVGSGGSGSWGDLLLALLAEQKACAMVLDVLDIDPGPEAITVTRDLGRGSREILALRGAAVLGIADSASPLLYVSRYRRQAVRLALPAAGSGPTGDPLAAVSAAWVPARPRVKTGNLSARTRGSASGRLQALLGINAGVDRENDRPHRIVADAAICARHLLRFLRHHGFIAGAVPAPPAPTSPEAEAASRTPQRFDRPDSEASIWTPHLRGPRPLQGEVHGMARRPRPLQPGNEPSPQSRPGRQARGPRPLGQTAAQPGRGPRPI